MTRKPEVLLLAALLGWVTPARGQATPDRVTVPLTDPARPATVEVQLVNGGVTVKAYAGKEVIVEARTRERQRSREATEGGLRRIQVNSSGLEIEEHNNVVKVETGSPHQSIDIALQVPARTNLKLEVVNGGDITVEGVEGEHEIQNVNGNVTMSNIAGSAVAHALNGRVQATFARVNAQKAMSFSSLNGRIDVTFPADLKANVKLKSDNGDVFSDFDIALKQAPAAVTTEEKRDQRGRYRVKIDRAVFGSINGGGPEIQFSNMNGPIYIRKAGAAAK